MQRKRQKILVIIVIIVITAFGTVFSLRGLGARASNVSLVDFAANFFVPLSATVVALLGVAITIYIFLYEGLREMKLQREYIRKVVDRLVARNGRLLVVLSLISFVSLILGILLSNNFGDFYELLYILYIISSYGSIGVLVWYNIALIDYDVVIYEQAVRECKWEISAYPEEPLVSGMAEIEEYIKVTSDLMGIVSVLVEENSKLLGHLPENRKLASVLRIVSLTSNKSDLDERSLRVIANDFGNLIDILNCAVTALEYGPEQDADLVIKVPLEKAKAMERLFVSEFMAGSMFKGHIFSDKVYKDANFENTSFDESFFNDVVLENARLNDSSFRSCRLQDFELKGEGASYVGVDFSHAKFLGFHCDKGSGFVDSDFSEADFSETGFLKDNPLSNIFMNGSNLSRTYFDKCHLERIDMQNIDGIEIKFDSATLVDVNFRNAKLTNGIFSNSRIVCTGRKMFDNEEDASPGEASMNFANLEEANFFQAVMENLRMEHVRMSKASFGESHLSHCSMHESFCDDVSFVGSRFDHVDMNHSLLSHADFSHGVFKGEGTSFESCLCTEAIFIKTEVRGTAQNKISFRNAHLINAQFVAGIYEQCDFSGAVFDGAIISSETRFSSCDFAGADFEGADILGDFDLVFDQSCTHPPRKPQESTEHEALEGHRVHEDADWIAQVIRKVLEETLNQNSS